MTSETKAYTLLPPSSSPQRCCVAGSALHMYVLHLTASAWMPNYNVERPCSRAACDFPEEALQVTHMARLFPYMVPLLHIPTSLSSMYIRGFTKFGIKVAWRLQFLELLRTLTLKGSDQNWCFPDSAQLAVSAKLRQLTGQGQENINFGRSLLKF